jgi:hypothetical protein
VWRGRIPNFALDRSAGRVMLPELDPVDLVVMGSVAIAELPSERRR